MQSDPTLLNDLDLSVIPDSNSNIGTNDPTTSEIDCYTRDFKIHCASVWLLKGVHRTTAEECKVPWTTFYQWVKSAWWPVAVEAARKLYSAEITAGFARIQQKCQEQLLDRLENGDAVVNRDGEVRRIPVKAKDMAVISAIAFDKRQIASGNPTSIRHNKRVTAEQKADELRARAKERGELKVVGGRDA